MAVIKIGNRAEKPFAQIDNRLLNDARLSWRAKGLLCYLIGKPTDWTIVADHLVKQGTEGRDAVRTAFQELKALGYASLETFRDGDTGKVTGSVWSVHEVPINREPEKPHAGKPDAGKSATTNTDDTNTEKTTKKASPKAERFQKPERTEVYLYGAELALDFEPCDAFYDYQESKGWKVGHSPMKCWQAALRTWKRNADKFGAKSFQKPGVARPASNADAVWQGDIWLLCDELKRGESFDAAHVAKKFRKALQYTSKLEVMDYIVAQNMISAQYDQLHATMISIIPGEGKA